MYNNRFCFKISADAGMARDGEGNNSPAYLEVKFDTNKELDSIERKVVHERLLFSVAKQLDINSKHLSKISEKEYDDNH